MDEESQTQAEKGSRRMRAQRRARARV